MIQSQSDLERWYQAKDPWQYEANPEDSKRKQVLLSELPKRTYNRVLDIGCGHGFVTRDLPGKNIIGVDISQAAVDQGNAYAKRHKLSHLKYEVGDLFTLDQQFDQPFDLIIITGVLYPQYIGKAHPTIYRIIDRMLTPTGNLISVHVDEWYRARFPYLRTKEYFYPYREFQHRLEVYYK